MTFNGVSNSSTDHHDTETPLKQVLIILAHSDSVSEATTMRNNRIIQMPWWVVHIVPSPLSAKKKCDRRFAYLLF